MIIRRLDLPLRFTALKNNTLIYPHLNKFHRNVPKDYYRTLVDTYGDGEFTMEEAAERLGVDPDYLSHLLRTKKVLEEVRLVPRHKVYKFK